MYHVLVSINREQFLFLKMDQPKFSAGFRIGYK